MDTPTTETADFWHWLLITIVAWIVWQDVTLPFRLLGPRRSPARRRSKQRDDPFNPVSRKS